MTATSLPLPSEMITVSPGPFPAGAESLPASHADSHDGEPRALAEIVDHEAMAYRAWGTPAGDFLARQMERLAQLIRWTGASTPEEHEARMEVWDDEVREQWYDRGYHEGLEAGRLQGARVRRDERY